jgi:hypothetical protein
MNAINNEKWKIYNMNTTHYKQHARGVSQTPRWSKEDIRAARMVAIAPFLEKRGMHLSESGGGNYTIREYPGLIIKESYWRWPEREIGGNAIDLCQNVLRLGFNEAMVELTQALEKKQKLPEPEAS